MCDGKHNWETTFFQGGWSYYCPVCGATGDNQRDDYGFPAPDEPVPSSIRMPKLAKEYPIVPNKILSELKMIPEDFVQHEDDVKEIVVKNIRRRLGLNLKQAEMVYEKGMNC